MHSNRNDNQSLTDEAALEVIVNHARRCDRKALKEFLSQGYSVGLRVNGITAVEILAMDGDVDAVNFLLDHFCAGMSSAARGYARAGNVEQVEALLDLGASMNAALEGYAISQMHEYVDGLIRRGAEIYHAVYGYAQVNAVARLKNLDDLLVEKIKSMHSMAEKFLVRENMENAKKLGFIKASNIAAMTALMEDAASVGNNLIMALADAGQFDLVEACIDRPDDRKRAIRYAAEGYAMGGYQDQVERLLQSGAEMSDAICGYAKSGLLRYAIELIKKSDNKEDAYLDLINGLMHAGQVLDCNEYFQMCIREFKWFSKIRNDDIAGNLNGYRYSMEAADMYSDDRMCLRILSFSNSEKMLQLLVETLEYYDSNHQGKYQLLAAKAREINRWMNEYDLGYSNALKIISLTESERVWCLQGDQMTKRRDENDEPTQALPIIPYEIFLSITAKMLGLSVKNTELVVAALHENMMAESVKRNVRQFENGLFSRQQMIDENVKADEKFRPILRFN